jgi:hypothetical protein
MQLGAFVAGPGSMRTGSWVVWRLLLSPRPTQLTHRPDRLFVLQWMDVRRLTIVDGARRCQGWTPATAAVDDRCRAGPDQGTR